MADLDDLASRHCRPLRGAEHRLGAADAAERLRTLPGWQLLEDGAAIGQTFAFADYWRTMAFVNALAYVAHREDHHPDLGVHYNRVVVRYSTHDVGGLSENDFICAAKASALYAARPE
jgi:4a-hydroxytetrahydrobiopterin dehydratase